MTDERDARRWIDSVRRVALMLRCSVVGLAAAGSAASPLAGLREAVRRQG